MEVTTQARGTIGRHDIMRSMPIRGHGFDLLGLTITRSGPVTGLAHLALDEGLMALYGVNGVGKTTLLKLAAQALRGEAPQRPWNSQTVPSSSLEMVLDVHLKLHEPLRPPPKFLQDRRDLDVLWMSFRKHAEDLMRGLAAGMSQRANVPENLPLLEQLVHLTAVSKGWVQANTRRASGQNSEMHELAGHHVPALTEAARAGRITLRASGTGAVPTWKAYLACSASEPTSAQALQEADGAYRSWRTNRPKPIEPRTIEDLMTAPYVPGPPKLIPPHFQVTYWGKESAPHYSPEVPTALQVPTTVYLGEVVGGHWLVHPGPAEVGEWEPGFEPAVVAGNVPEVPMPNEEMLRDLLATTPTAHEGVFGEGTSELDREFRGEIDWRVKRANELIGVVLPGACELLWNLPEPEELIRGVRPAWSFNDLGLEELSEAQRKWVGLSCSAASAQGPPVVVLIDEPEAGLHRAVEHRLASGLAAWARSLSGSVLVATHSPAVLSSPHTASLFVTTDDEGGIALRRVPLSLLDGAEIRRSAHELGLTVGDLGAMSRVTVVVEGIHDAWVFKALLRDDLDSSAAGLYPIHGAARLKSLADAQLLVAGTDAAIVIVLDELNLNEGRDALTAIRDAVTSGDSEETRSALESVRLAGRKNDSLLFLHQFASEAMKLDALDRITVHGLSYPDVICYLDPDTVLTKVVPWDELIERWKRDAAPAEPKNLKGWLRRNKFLPDDQEAVDNAVEFAALRMRDEHRPLHQDLVGLGLNIRDLGSRN